MSVMGNRVQSFGHEVGSVIVRWYMRKGKRFADEMFSCKVVGYMDVLGSRIDHVVHCTVDGRRII